MKGFDIILNEILFLGHLSREKCGFSSQQMPCEDVIITKKRIKHCNEEDGGRPDHPDAYNEYAKYIPCALSYPDLITTSQKNNPKRIEIYKHFRCADCTDWIVIIVEIAEKANKKPSYNKIKTLHKTRESEVNRIKKKVKILYENNKEDKCSTCDI